MTPNVEHMSLHSIENKFYSLWGKLVQFAPLEVARFGDIYALAPRHGLLKLESLTLKMYANNERISLNAILHALVRCPLLTELRLAGASKLGFMPLPWTLTLKNLQFIKLTECNLAVEDVDDCLMACDDLRHFFCQWSSLRCQLPRQQVDLLPNLRKQRNLETLSLLTVREEVSDTDKPFVSCSSIRELPSLKVAQLCNLFIPYNRWRYIPYMGIQDTPIAQELPAALEHLSIFYTVKCTREDCAEYVSSVSDRKLVSCRATYQDQDAMCLQGKHITSSS